MDFMNRGMMGSLFGGQRSDFRTIFSIKPLTPSQQSHLSKVYATIAAGVMVAAVGAYVTMFNFHIPSLLCIITQIGCVMYIGATSDQMKISDPKRLGAYAAAAFCSGSVLAPLLTAAHFISEEIIAHAFLGTLAIFTCFSLCAIYARKRAYLYIGSILSSAVFYMSLISIFNMFYRTKLAHDVIIYGGLITFIGYVFYHTQETIEEFSRGKKDYILHALRLFMTLVSIFVRILIILMENKNEKKTDGDRSPKRR